jgi:uncharacterized protein DUF5989
VGLREHPHAFWLLPLLRAFGGLTMHAKGSALAPLIYAIF